MSQTNQFARDYEHDTLYGAVIKDQNVVKRKKDGTLSVVLTFQLKEQYLNKFEPSKGSKVLPEEKQVGKEVWLNLSGSTLEKSFSFLKAFGFNSHQVNRLKPGHPDHHSLIGQHAYLKCAYAKDKNNPDAEKEWWNIQTFDAKKTSEEILAEVNDAFKNDEDYLKDAWERSQETVEAF